MDAVSYSKAAQQAARIEKIVTNPDSTSGLVTLPSTIATGETIVIPSGRTVVHPNLQVDGTLDIQGTLFVPSGGSHTTEQVITGSVIADSITLQGASITRYSGHKNHIINGNFDLWDYGTIQTTVSGYGSDNRWSNNHTGSTAVCSRQTCTDIEKAAFNSSYYSRTVVSSVAGVANSVSKLQRIENAERFAGKQVTVSFIVKSDTNKNMVVELGKLYGSGGTPTVTEYLPPITIACTPIWTKKMITFTVPSDIGKTYGTDVNSSSIQLLFLFDAGSNYNARSNNLGQQSGTFDIAQVQLELGAFGTPFEMRDITLEKMMCARYLPIAYVSNGGYFYAGAAFSTSFGTCTIPFMVPSRIPPSGISVSDSDVRFVNGSANPVGTGISLGYTDTTKATIMAAGVTTFTPGQVTALYKTAAGIATILFTGCEL